jgi:DNA-binding NarL/FixJ family response regulator
VIVKRIKSAANGVDVRANGVVNFSTDGSGALAAASGDVAFRGSMPISTLIVMAERLVGEALRLLLAREPGLDVVGEAASWPRATYLIETMKPDVVLLDPAVPNVDHAEAVTLVRRHSPRSRVLLLVSSLDAPAICRAVQAGANGYVEKTVSVADVARAIRGVHAGEMWVERKLFSKILVGLTTVANNGRTETVDERLTPREREILRRLASGGTNRRIANALFISETTVKTHLNNIFRKLNVTRRLQAVLYAVSHGLQDR